MSLVVLSNVFSLDSSVKGVAIDVVAIHGLYEGQIDTWTDPRTKVLWLRDLFPHEQLNARVLAYGYATKELLHPGSTADGILSRATSLIAELYALREQTDTVERPIIFICHGIGGLFLKRALVLSNASRGDQVEHRRSIFISTYAILFMGTPHSGMNKDAVSASLEHKIRGPNQFLRNMLDNSEVLRDITDQFAPIMSEFQIHYFWEEHDTKFLGFRGRIVPEHSAAPAWHNVDRCGIQATHSDMVKFSTVHEYGYPVIFAALCRYIKKAPSVIGSKWTQKRLAEKSCNKILEFKQMGDLLADPQDINEIYAVNRSSSNYFTGREQYAKDLKAAFDASPRPAVSHRQRIFVIYGLGGSGKTQFALKYIEDNKSSFWGVFWIDASSEESAEAGFASIGLQSGKGANFAAGIYWLSVQTNPWILIINNADDPDLDVSKYFPVGNKGHILVTTRNPSFTSLATVGSFSFRGMDPEEATSLLLKSAHLFASESFDARSQKLAQGIASELGYLALALNHAGATIRRNIYTLDEYLHYYLGHRRKILSYSEINDPDDANIITTWEIPFRKIEARESVACRDAVDLMHIFAFLHFESICENIFHTFWYSANGIDISNDGYPDILQIQSMLTEELGARVRRAFRILREYSIIDYDPGQEVCSLHPVVHAWAGSRLSPVDYARWLGCTSAMLAQCVSSSLEASGREFRRQLLSHIDNVLRKQHRLFPSYPETIKQATEIDKFASVYAENGFWKQARNLRRKVLDLRVQKLGRWHEDTLQSRAKLAETYWNLFEIKSCLDIQYSALKSNWFLRPSLANLAQILWLAGRLDLSKQVGERAFDGLSKYLGFDDPVTLDAMFNLGRTYHHLKQYEKSCSYLVCVVRRRKHFFGNNHPETLMARNELGICYRAMGRVNVAKTIIGNVLEARKKTLGEEHAYTLWSVNEYSKVLSDCGRPERAILMLEDIVPIVKRTLGENHVGMIMTQSNLARAYAINKRWFDAADILKDLSQATKPEHPDWTNIMGGYTHVRVKIGLLDETEEDCNLLLETLLKKK